jgi:hypothetical protein
VLLSYGTTGANPPAWLLLDDAPTQVLPKSCVPIPSDRIFCDGFEVVGDDRIFANDFELPPIAAAPIHSVTSAVLTAWNPFAEPLPMPEEFALTTARAVLPLRRWPARGGLQ